MLGTITQSDIAAFHLQRDRRNDSDDDDSDDESVHDYTMLVELDAPKELPKPPRRVDHEGPIPDDDDEREESKPDSTQDAHEDDTKESDDNTTATRNEKEADNHEDDAAKPGSADATEEPQPDSATTPENQDDSASKPPERVTLRVSLSGALGDYLQITDPHFANRYVFLHGKLPELIVSILAPPCALSYLEAANAYLPMLHRRTELTGDTNWLRTAIVAGLMGIDFADAQGEEWDPVPEIHPERARGCLWLSRCLSDWWKVDGDPKVLDLALKYAVKCVEHAPDEPEVGGETLDQRVNHVAHLYFTRHNLTGDPEDCRQAVEWGRRTLASIPEHKIDAHRPTWLANMSGYLLSLHEHTPNDETLFPEAIAMATEANSLTPDGHWDKPERLANLGAAYAERYDVSSALSDLEAAIAYTKSAVLICGPDNKRMPDLMGNLSSLCRTRWLRTDEPGDASAAVLWAWAAMQNTPPDDARNRAARYVHLGKALVNRAVSRRDFGDLEAGLENLTLGCQSLTPHTPPSTKADYLNTLSRALEMRNAILERDVGLNRDLEPARVAAQTAVQLIPDTHPDRAWLLTGMAVRHYQSFLSLDGGDVEELYEAMRLCIKVWRMSEAPIAQRVNAADQLVTMLSSCPTEELPVGIVAGVLDGAVRALPLLSGKALLRGDQIEVISERGELVTTAASFVLEAGGSAFDALSLLEVGRCVVNGHLMDYRADLSSLEAAHPELSKRFRELTAALDASSGLSSLSLSASGKSAQAALARADKLKARRQKMLDDIKEKYEAEDPPRVFDRSRFKFVPVPAQAARKLKSAFGGSSEFQMMQAVLEHVGEVDTRKGTVAELNKLVEEIRSLEGFENFLGSLTEQEIMDTAGDGVIVIVNSTFLRSDAIIVTGQSITSIPLPDLTYPEAKDYLGTLADAISTISPATHQQVNTLLPRTSLPWLWHTTVRPVLSHLSLLNKQSADNPKRIWWIGTGVMANAPFHAAGDYSSREVTRWRTGMRYSVPGYTATVRALRFSRQLGRREKNGEGRKGGVLVVAMPDTPGMGKLAAGREVEAMRPSVGGEGMKVMMMPAAGEVLEEMKGGWDVVHFACHGVTHHKDPTRSFLALSKPADVVGELGTQMDNKLKLEDEDTTRTAVAGPEESKPEEEEKEDTTPKPVLDRLTVAALTSTNLAQQAPRLAVLSACSTIRNDGKGGLAEECQHLGFSFQLAGVRGVVGTLWEAEDEGCVAFSGALYRRLYGREEKGETIRGEEEEGEDTEAGSGRGETTFCGEEDKEALAYRNAMLEMMAEWGWCPTRWVPFVYLGA